MGESGMGLLFLSDERRDFFSVVKETAKRMRNLSLD
jgi:hypothetical protein